MGLPPQALPEGDSPLRLPSSLRGGLKQILRNQVSLRSLTTFFFFRFAIWGTGGTFGALIRETRIVAHALLAISDFRHAESRTAGA